MSLVMEQIWTSVLIEIETTRYFAGMAFMLFQFFKFGRMEDSDLFCCTTSILIIFY